MTKLIQLFNLFLPDGHYQDAQSGKTKSKFHQEHMKKTSAVLTFWVNAYIESRSYLRVFTLNKDWVIWRHQRAVCISWLDVTWLRSCSWVQWHHHKGLFLSFQSICSMTNFCGTGRNHFGFTFLFVLGFDWISHPGGLKTWGDPLWSHLFLNVHFSSSLDLFALFLA